MILSIARKELKSMFASPMGWIILSVLMFVLATYFLNTLNQYFAILANNMQYASRIGVTIFIGQGIFDLASLVMLFSVPLLSMRLISEERRSQTLPFLFSAPLSLTEIVLGKFVGLMSFLSIIISFVAALLCILATWTELDFGFIFSNVLGLWLLLASFSALGLYFSSLTAQPVIAAILTFVTLLALLSIDHFSAGTNYDISHLSLLYHFEPFTQGLIDTRNIVFFLLFTVAFLSLTIHRLNAERLHA